MARSNAHIVRDMYEAFNRGDLAKATTALHPEAELHQPPEIIDSDSYYGRDEFARGFVLWLSEWEQPRFEPLELDEEGELVVMRVRVSGTGKASGLRSTVEFFHAWTVRDGKPHRCFVRSSRAEAVAAARAS